MSVFGSARSTQPRASHTIAQHAVPFPCAARRSFVLRCVCVVVPAHAQLDGESASCSPGHRAMCWSPLAHAQQLPSIESLSESYQSAFVRRLGDFGASNLSQATEQAFLDCQLEEMPSTQLRCLPR